MKIASNPIDQIFGGTVKPPISTMPSDPREALGKLISMGIMLFITVAVLFCLIYLLMGAYDWIVSSGEKERLTKAQNKIVNALIGLIIVFAVLAIFSTITGKILGIFDITANGWKFILPTL